MIVAAGLTPAWQQILEFDRFLPGEVNRAASARWCASGKVANVGVALSHLGGESRTICPFGGETGRAAADDLVRLGVPLFSVEVGAATRVCTTILDRSTGRTTELVENAGPLSDGEVEECLAVWRAVAARAASHAVLAGSLPEGTSSDFYRRLMESAPSTTFVLDARGPELLAALPLRPFVVKPNVEELARTVGRRLESDDDVWEAMRRLVELGATWVVVTQGPAPVRVLSESARFRCVPPQVPVVNPIGCGDSLAAGLAWKLRQGGDLVEAVRFGVAAAADNVSQLLPARLDLRRIEALMPQVQVDV